jgi:serine/threonine-protein kinase
VVNEIHTTETELGELDFLTMEFLDGETLACRLARGKLDEQEARDIARQLCAGVAAAHRSGILHRDLKTGNVILCRQKDGSIRAVITDFGLSTDSMAPSEVEGGTPNYMAPEVSRGGKASQASDVFSLGAVLYEMVTGQKPFPASADDSGTTCTPIAPSKLGKNLPRRWDAVILPCLRSGPEERCSAEQILKVLERKPLYRRPAVATAVAACLVLAALVFPKIVEVFAPPPIRLAVLPVGATSGLAQRGQQVLEDVAERVKREQGMQPGKAMISVIPPSKALSKGVATAHDAGKVLGATHALLLELRPETDGLAAEGAIIDLATMAHVRDYSAHFAEADLADLRTGLTGFVTWALHLRRTSGPETVAPPAATAFKNGREYLGREPHDFVNAVPELQEAARLDPHSPLPPAGLVEAYARAYRAQREENALREAWFWLARAEALNADSPTVRMASGFLHQILGNYPKALEDYQRAEEIEPGNAEALLGSGLAYESEGILDKATKEYGLAISVDPNYYKPYEYLAALHFYHGHYAEAEEPYKKDIEHAPNRMDAYGSLAGVYTAQAKYADAEGVYKKLLGLKETPIQLNNLGVDLAFQGRQREAIGYYRRAIAMNPNGYIYWLNLGDSQRRVKNRINAKNSYQQGLQLARKATTANAANASARAYLAYLEARLGFKGEAKSQIAEALNSPARDDQVVLCAVKTYEALGERERALAAAAMATSQTRTEMDHHPDLADLQRDSRFRSLVGQVK